MNITIKKVSFNQHALKYLVIMLACAYIIISDIITMNFTYVSFIAGFIYLCAAYVGNKGVTWKD